MKKELISNLLLLAGAIIIAILVIEWTIQKSQLDVQIHDTYFVTPTWLLQLVFAALLVYLLFIAQGMRNKFRQKIPVKILLGANTILVISFTLLLYPVLISFPASVLPAYLVIISFFMLSGMLVVKRLNKLNNLTASGANSPYKKIRDSKHG